MFFLTSYIGTSLPHETTHLGLDRWDSTDRKLGQIGHWTRRFHSGEMNVLQENLELIRRQMGGLERMEVLLAVFMSKPRV